MAYGEKKTPETIERLRSYADKPINPDKPLTIKEKKFLELIVIHNKEPWKAYDEIYTAKIENRTKQCCQTKANQILKKANVAKRYKKMTEEMNKTLIQQGLWTKDEAIEKLRDMINRNEEEQKRINETCNAEIDLLLIKIQEADTADKKEKLINQVMKLRKSIRNNSINNNAILTAISELNKMHGYNSQEITLKHDEEFEIDKKLEQMSVEQLTALLYKKENEQ